MFPDELLRQAAQALDLAKAKDMRIATAETCTAGLVSSCLTSVPGASKIFERGFVLYHDSAKATGLVIPEVKGKIDGISVRVPTPDVSFTDLVAEVERPTTVADVNAAFKAAAAKAPLLGILGYSEVELVSVDYVGNAFSCTLDSKSTAVIDGSLVKICGWYDNEWGYASRCVDLLRFVGARL